MPRQIFRQQSLDKLSSPERLDQMLRIVRPQGWIIAATTGIGLGLVVLWGIVGRVPVTASGSGILVRPKQVVGFQAPANGQVERVLVDAGARVAKGDMLLTLRLPALEKELEQEIDRLALTRAHGTELTQLERHLAEQEKSFLEQRTVLLEKRIERVRQSADRYLEQATRYIEEQRANLRQAVELSETIGSDLAERYAGLESLRDRGGASPSELLQPRRELFDSQLRRAELGVREVELNLQEGRVREYHDERLDVIADFEAELLNLGTRRLVIERRLAEDRIDQERRITEIEQRIRQLRVRLETEGQVRSEFAGVILEVTAAIGQQVGLAEPVGRMEIEDPEAVLKAIAYLPIRDGKRIEAGQRLRISPGTVERERYGGIVGTVDSVSTFPVTRQAVAAEIGDEDMARQLLGNEARIQVVATLRTRDPGPPDDTLPSHYQWTSGDGPPDEFRITAGTTSAVRITIEERAPITLVLPFLESMIHG